jgi:2-polyprenyl-3-methyl-5-hydroxy-6-metoxy-1,4-benzoquinol methylase
MIAEQSREDLNQYQPAYSTDFKFHDENLMMLTWYADRIRANLAKRSIKSLLSLGIGHQVVSGTIVGQLGKDLDCYTIVEGSADIIADFKAAHRGLPNGVELVHSYFEEYRPSAKFDALELGFVLEHVDDPARILSTYKNYLNANGKIFIAVPNARSLHRLLGHAGQLLDDVYRLSPEDIQLGHKRYFDLDGLLKLIHQSGLKTVVCEGIMLKPVTTKQLQELKLRPEITKALFQVGAAYPEICNSIYVEAVL